MFVSGLAANQDVNIHYLDTLRMADHHLTPIIICPGLSEAAEEYEDLLAYLLPRRAVVLSFRGRGRSDTPRTKYDLADHVSDLAAVVQETGIERFHLMGNSRGVSYALGFAQKNADQIVSLIVEDYPAEHKQMSAEWADEYINQYLIPTGRNKFIRQQAVKGIQRDSTPVRMEAKLALPAMVIRGMLEGSLLSEADMLHYKHLFSILTVKEFANSAHAIRATEREQLYLSIKQFLDEQDA
ncbi:alpha/beta fold hydrolase [Paenibacillus sp. PL91]|uniref:alpha/beta fold hydrolase n=1 Tax=Paenibacillus sp. PL91 TaxID=2729538 RepID=UPI00145F1342|nr:alpha/beta fold hydrolase [Paenibacillus sp. PL91]MBC9199357.1 alpha/beta fold hydrolase [Paenibacillus sp. PL91]